MTTLILKPTDLGDGKLTNDFEVLDADRKPVGRIHVDARGQSRLAVVLDDNRAPAATPA